MYRLVLIIMSIICFLMFVMSGAPTTAVGAALLPILLLTSVVAFGFVGVIDTLCDIKDKIKK